MLRGSPRQLEALDAYMRHHRYRLAANEVCVSERTLKRLIYQLRDANGCDDVMEMVIFRAEELLRAA